jgi:hypothetical protein
MSNRNGQRKPYHKEQWSKRPGNGWSTSLAKKLFKSKEKTRDRRVQDKLDKDS